MKSSKQSGFTIVELMIATTVFSMVMLVCAAAIIYIGKMYYKGSLISRTQETSRDIIEDVAQTVQFGPRGAEQPQQAPEHNGYRAYCIGNVRYTYSTGVSQSSATPVLWRDRVAGSGGACEVAEFNEPSGVEMLGENMRLPVFTVTVLNGAWNIDLLVAYGQDLTLFNGNDPANGCVSVELGGQFCAVSRNNTTVVKRL